MIAYCLHLDWISIIARAGWIVFRLPVGEICYDWQVTLDVLPYVAFCVIVLALIFPPSALLPRRNAARAERVK